MSPLHIEHHFITLHDIKLMNIGKIHKINKIVLQQQAEVYLSAARDA